MRQNLFDTLDDFRRLVDNVFGDLGQFFTADRGNLQITLGRIGQQRWIGHALHERALRTFDGRVRRRAVGLAPVAFRDRGASGCVAPGAFVDTSLTGAIVDTRSQNLLEFPDVRARLGIRWADLEPLNGRLVYASLTAYGESGPEANKTGFDATAWWARTN